MNDKILSINLETQTAPIVQEVRGRDYIEYGTEDWKNLYPQFLIDLYYNSSTHAAIINATAEMIAGEELVIEDDDTNLDVYVKLKKFMRHANGKETLHQIIKKVAFDFKLQGAYALHIIWNVEKTAIAEIHHVPVERVRAGKPNEMGVIDTYYISADWGNTRVHKPSPIAAFNTKDRTAPSQLLYTGAYSPNMDIYHTPDYLACCNWALCDQKVAEFHLNNIENGFSGSYFISFANGVPTQEERLQIEQSLKDKFTGAQNSGKFVLTFSDDKTRTPEITPISVSDADKQYLALQELLVQNILTGHRVTSPMLMGIKSNTGLGNNANELNSAANFYLNSVVKGFQNHILDTLQTIFSVNNIDLEVGFVQLKPITLEFTNEDLKAVMQTNEIREELGLAPIDEEIQVKEQLSKVGTMITDGIEMPLYETIEEAEAESKKLGCTGYHEHTQDGNTYYMPCQDHEQIMNLNKCGCKEEFISPNPCEDGYEAYGTKIKDGREVPNCVPIKASKHNLELHNFINEYGEDEPVGYVLLDEELVGDEHEEFDFEQKLNDSVNEKYNFISTGRANPNARDDEDGLNRQGNAFFKVRYRYTKISKNPKSSSRDFCNAMMSANKLYRKRDIINMGTKAVNPGFGPRGANTYSIWFYKGGGACYHKWTRLIYQADPTDDNFVYYPDNIDADKLISNTKAKSDGFTLEKLDSLVETAPINMPNQGFLK